MAASCGQRGTQSSGYLPATARPAAADPRSLVWWTSAAERAGRLVPAAALPAADLAGLAGAVAVTGQAVLPSALYALAVLVVLAGSRLHRLRVCLRVADQTGRILLAAALPLLIMLPWLTTPVAERLAVSSAVLVIGCRTAMCAALRAAHRDGALTEPALVVGGGTSGAAVGDLMLAHPELGLRPAGFLDGGTPRQDLPLPCLGTPADLAEVVARWRIRRVIVCQAACDDEDLAAVLRATASLRADVCVVPRLHELGVLVPHSSLDDIWGIPLIPLRGLACSPAGLRLKRAFDVVVAAGCLAVALPLLALLAVAIRLDSGQPPLFRQIRVTGAGRHAVILKLRTLATRGDPDTSWTVPARHSTRLGRWLRVTHLDELPQLLNVLRGEMSLVGPRPERPHFAEQFDRDIPGYRDRTRMPAGMTGWAQVHGLHGDTSIVERARFDNRYIEHWSPWLDLVILARTVGALCHRPRTGRSARAARSAPIPGACPASTGHAAASRAHSISGAQVTLMREQFTEAGS